MSTSVCDAATLGELFRHLHSDHQITRFVQAFEELRQKHVKGLLEADLANFGVFSMPAGEAHEQRDVLVKEKYRAGVDAFMAFMGDEDDEVAAVWEVRVPVLVLVHGTVIDMRDSERQGLPGV